MVILHDTAPPPAAVVFLTGQQVRTRYSVSVMWLHRRCNDGSGFPQPVKIMGRNFWRLAELEAWESKLPSKAA